MLRGIAAYYVQPAGRDWERCLGRPATIPAPDLSDIGQERWYRTYEKVLVLIHPDEREWWIKIKWEQLPDDVREHTLWLVVSGSGYPTSGKWSERVHFLRYPLSADTLKLQEVEACFRRFLHQLEQSTSAFSIPDWGLLYPPENLALITLYALLSAAKTFDVYAELQSLAVNKGMMTAYRQYLTRVELTGLNPEIKETDFLQLAKRQVPSEILERVFNGLKRTFGTVPD